MQTQQDDDFVATDGTTNPTERVATTSESKPLIGLQSFGGSKRPKPYGILRLDINKPRRSSGGSVDFRFDGSGGDGAAVGSSSAVVGTGTESNSGVTSPHQLSVTWAPPMQSNADVRREYFRDKGRRTTSHEDNSYDLASPTQEACDFRPRTSSNELRSDYTSFSRNASIENDNENDDDDDEDYSVSVSAIMQRRASIRGYRGKRGSRNSRRTSSPMDHVLDSVERRRSSVYTTSSDEGTNQESTQEQIFENIRLHKEVIQSVKLQPWPIRKKLKLVRQAKTYVARHEGALQERFAMSRSTKDLWARFKILMAARWRHWKRETASFLTVLIPWELRIKEIESHFGSGVASYFTFLRWLMWVNIMIAIPLVAFVIGPEYFATKHDESDPRKKMSEHEYKAAGNLFTFWEFEGYLKYSPMFYGYYSSTSGISTSGYKLPLAYFLTAVVVYIYSFVATLRKMAENSRNSKLSSKDDECVFSWKLFTGWDFMIGHAETAHNRIASVVVGFKEALLEEAEKKKDTRNWRIILQRILVNILVTALLVTSGYTVVRLVNKSEEWAHHDNWLSRNAVNVTMTLLSFFLPMIFEALGLFENWHPRQQLRLQLARIMILNMLNLYSLMFSFIYKINSKEKPLQELKSKNDSCTAELHELMQSIEVLRSMTATTLSFGDAAGSSTTELSTYDDALSTLGDGMGRNTETILASTAAALLVSTVNRLKCYNVTIKCSSLMPVKVNKQKLATTLLLLNLTTTAIMPTMMTTTEPITTTTIPEWTTTIESKMPSSIEWMTTTEPTTISTTTTTTTLPTTLPTTTPTTTTPSTTPITTTTTAYESEETTTTSEETTTFSATYTPSSTTTTPAPGNDSFFNYWDYFDGLPLDFPGAVDLATVDHSDTAETNEEETLRRKARAADVNPSPLSLFPSRYSRRQHNGSTSEPPTTSTTTTTTTTTNADTTTDEPVGSQKLTDEELQEVFAFFMTTTTTEPPPLTPTIHWDNEESTSFSETTLQAKSTTTTTTTARTTTANSRASDEQSGPFFVKYEDIPKFGNPIYLNFADMKQRNQEYCTVLSCQDVPLDFFATSTDATYTSDGSTWSSDSTELATVTLRPLEQKAERLKIVQKTLRDIQRNLTSMCWETSLGQELSKVIVFDGLMSIVAPLCIDFLRALFVRYVNQHWCWDMEKTFPQYGDFKIAENILTLINNQGQVWMGIFFSPGLVLINLAKLMIMMYFRSWIVLTCNVPHEVVFKASKSNNFYLSLLLTMLFLCVLPVGYAIVWLRPSWHCGPFSEYNRIAEFITNTTRNALPKQLHEPLDYLTSSSTVIPLLLLLILIIYYLVSLTGALREANQDLRTQLQKEREEERKKIFKVPEVKQAEQTAATLTNRWRKVLDASSPVTPIQTPDFETEEYKNQARKELISRIMKKALRKGSATSDDDSFVRRDDDDTDTEHQDSLPHDEECKEKRSASTKLQQIRRTRKPSLVDIVQIAKNERARAAATTPTAVSPVPLGNKEMHPKNRFKVDRHDKKEKDTKDAKENKESKDSKDSNDSKEAKDRRDTNEDKDSKEKPKENHAGKEQKEYREPKPRDTKVNPETKSPPPPYHANDGHDAETNTRVVNERRISLLRRKDSKKANANKESATKQSTESPTDEKDASKEIKPLPKSNFEVIDEKKSHKDTTEPRPHKERHFALPTPPTEIGIGKFKFRRSIKKAFPSRSKNGPEVFKFDEQTVDGSKSVRQADIPELPIIEHLHTENQLQGNGDELPSPSSLSPTLRQINAEKLAQLSRQGRKKIGSLLALMREAVNLKREEEEQSSNSNESPTTPTIENGVTVLSSTPSTAIDIPSTPEANEPLPPPVFPTSESAASAPIAIQAKQPPIPKLAALADLEELDLPGPITFPTRSASQKRRKTERQQSTRRDSQASIWSDNIPTITISTTGSDECIVEPTSQPPVPVGEPVPTPESVSTPVPVHNTAPLSAIEAAPVSIPSTTVPTSITTTFPAAMGTPIPASPTVSLPTPTVSTSPRSTTSPIVNIIKINIEDDDDK